MVQMELLHHGAERIRLFCEVNNLPPPTITMWRPDLWNFDVCAYWRPPTEQRIKLEANTGIHICLEKCARIAPEQTCSNWNWPGCVIDREPYGVLCHEVGHLMDWTAGEKKGSYYSVDYCVSVMNESGEEKLTNYCPNPAEWFAEMSRLFISNHDLLKLLRPKTHEILCRRWKPVSNSIWTEELGDVPQRILRSQINKIQERLNKVART